jgi:hypothetical protein
MREGLIDAAVVAAGISTSEKRPAGSRAGTRQETREAFAGGFEDRSSDRFAHCGAHITRQRWVERSETDVRCWLRHRM